MKQKVQNEILTLSAHQVKAAYIREPSRHFWLWVRSSLKGFVCLQTQDSWRCLMSQPAALEQKQSHGKSHQHVVLPRVQDAGWICK